MTGTNNLLTGNPYFPVILGSMLPRLIDLCPQSSITLNSIMPMQLRGLAQESITAANNELREVAQQSGCHFLDTTAPFHEQCLPVTMPGFLNDGVHLSGAIRYGPGQSKNILKRSGSLALCRLSHPNNILM